MFPSKEDPIIFDACSLMIGVGEKSKGYSFERIAQLILVPIFWYFEDIRIHEVVYGELDEKTKNFLDNYIGKSVTIVSETAIDKQSAKYLLVKDKFARNPLISYKEIKSATSYGRNAGEVYSVSYATENNINYFSTRDYSVMLALSEIEECKDIHIVHFEIALAISYLYHCVEKRSPEHELSETLKALKSIYKKYCIRSSSTSKIPDTFPEYIKTISQSFLINEASEQTS